MISEQNMKAPAVDSMNAPPPPPPGGYIPITGDYPSFLTQHVLDDLPDHFRDFVMRMADKKYGTIRLYPDYDGGNVRMRCRYAKYVAAQHGSIEISGTEWQELRGNDFGYGHKIGDPYAIDFFWNEDAVVDFSDPSMPLAEYLLMIDVEHKSDPKRNSFTIRRITAS